MNDAMASLAAAFRGQAPGDFVAWGMLVVTQIVLIIYMRRQRRALQEMVQVPSERNQRALLQLAESRGWMICFLWGLLGLSVIVTDLQHPTRAEPEALPVDVVPIVPDATPPAAAPAAVIEGDEREQAIDKIKTYYEDAFVSYYYLNKCGVASVADNQHLYDAMLRELKRHDSLGTADEIVTAARGSFEVIYSQSPCDEKSLVPVQQQFNRLMSELSQ